MHPKAERARIRSLLRREKALWKGGLTRVAGIDEAGRGPLAGPVVAAAVIFSPGVSLFRVDDSKMLSSATRENLYGEIVATALAVGVGIVGVEEIDRYNILNATIGAMHQAIDNLSAAPHHLLVDGSFFLHEHVPYSVIVRGDARCFSIAAASIVAKVTRDRLMLALDEQFPVYGFAQHKGYGTRAHFAAIRAHGPCPAHRRSFLH